VDGVVRTRVGYAGGSVGNPNYYNLDGHSETIQIDYDPTKITYEELLAIFWDSHNPPSSSWSRQYMSIVFYHNDQQRELAVLSKERVEARLGYNVVTEITPFSKFYLAEDYHQKYYLRQEPVLVKELSIIYPDISEFIDSTAVARVNGYVGGYGYLPTLDEELSSLGFSVTGRNKLLEIADRGLVLGCPLPSPTQVEVK